MKNQRLELFLEQRKIAERVAQLAQNISADYQDKDLVLVCVLKGAFFFFVDLIRRLTVTPLIDFVAASSYHRQGSMGRVSLSPVFSTSIRGRDVLIIEDIIDTGLTYRTLTNYFSLREPASLRLCTLLDKPSERRTELIQPDYVGFVVPDRFLVGYGLDCDERYRELPDIHILTT
ncbi:MAG: hypoxanthine phosphoribosyltransferase [Candidatus Abyssobacteria bacterium SURF_5]|uniref:Hypoxanthine phosphoribosyltransferase n=1 Tax=Abyssobacteria bacterium (strain SURF_5) TaxID=2093360 RepID=A0A3A4NVU6_ABYX5|nr:MAG: hypoxanthine phosphoribosyltransferase [Candidatus Abyssubacteria bacterium SURF_5]